VIGVLESLCISYLPNLIRAFYDRYPKVNTIIKIGTFEELSLLLNNNTIDLLWTFDDPILNKNWVKAIAFPSTIKVIASPKHLLMFENQPIPLSAFKDCTFIFTEQTCSYRNHFESMLQSQDIPYHVFLEIGNTEIIKKFVESGLCLSILPDFSFQNESDKGTIGALNIENFQLTMSNQIFYHKNKILTSAMREFISLSYSKLNLSESEMS
jgi:DNA-binding transcriptional LysR family regulator